MHAYSAMNTDGSGWPLHPAQQPRHADPEALAQSHRARAMYPSPTRSDTHSDLGSYHPTQYHDVQAQSLQNSPGFANSAGRFRTDNFPSRIIAAQARLTPQRRAQMMGFKVEDPAPNVWPSAAPGFPGSLDVNATISPDFLQHMAFADSGTAMPVAPWCYLPPDAPMQDAQEVFAMSTPESSSQPMAVDDGGWYDPFATAATDAGIDEDTARYTLTPNSNAAEDRLAAGRVYGEMRQGSADVDSFEDQAALQEHETPSDEDEASADHESSSQSESASPDGESSESQQQMGSTEEAPRYRCEFCPKGFNRRYNYTQHLETHKTTRERSHICHCGKGFYRNTDLNRHENCHNQSRPFQCSNCNAGFPRRDSLQRHERTTCCEKRAKRARMGGVRGSKIKTEPAEEEVASTATAAAYAGGAGAHGTGRSTRRRAAKLAVAGDGSPYA